MTAKNKTWDSVKADYLRQVEKALYSVRHPRSKEVLEDVRSHLDRRFAELEPAEQTWENFQSIITEMGPASDYAELLNPDIASQGRNVSRKHLWWAGIAGVAIIAVAILLLTTISGTTDEADKRAAENLAADAWQLWRERKLVEAEDMFKKALEKDAGNANAWNGLGWSQFNRGKPFNAKVSFEKCLQIQPEHAAALNGLGWIAKAEGKTDEAIGHWQKAVEAAPAATAALSGLATTYMEMQEYDKAIEVYEKWLKVEPENKQVKADLERAKTREPTVQLSDLPHLIAELSNPNAPRFQALNRIIKLGTAAVPTLIEELKSSSNWQIPKALGAIGDERAILPLIEKLECSDFSPMREVVGEALERITGEKFGTSKEKWRTWWQENRQISGNSARGRQERQSRKNLRDEPAHINEQVAQLDIDAARLDDVIRIFGEPEKYLWGRQTFTKSNLPSTYVAAYYSNRLHIVMSGGKISELRFQGPGTGYVYKGKLQVGSSLDEALDVLGQPKEIVQGRAIEWKDGVLYKDINGTKGRCYYQRADQNIRIFFGDYKVAALYLTAGKSSEELSGSFQAVRPIQSVKDFDDVRWKDMSKLDLADKVGLSATLWFNQRTVWPDQAKMPTGPTPAELLKQAMNPGLGIRELHQQGITGKGVSVAIIDQPLYQDHPEFAGKIAAYHDVGCASESSMHGPAVASLLVGKNCGTAPGARVYYVAAPSWTKDTAYQAQAVDWLIEQNKRLPASEKIRVVSVSAAPSGPGSPFEKNQQMWDQSCARAEAEGMLVLDCTNHHGFIGPCWYDASDPENVTKCTPGFPGRPKSRSLANRILVPTCPRTTAEQYNKGEFSYQYCGHGGLSWAIPYCAGVLAMGWQIRPELTGEKMRELLFESAYVSDQGAKIINPQAFIALVRQTVSTDLDGEEDAGFLDSSVFAVRGRDAR
jgi:serine protease AprX